MTRMILDSDVQLYEKVARRPEARAFAAGELVRLNEDTPSVSAGAVLRVDGVDSKGRFVRLQRRNGDLVEWAPTRNAEVFAPTIGEVKRGTVLEWKGARRDLGARDGDLGLVVDVHPRHGVKVRSRKLGEIQLELETGAWQYAVSESGVVGHLRNVGNYRLEPYRDVDPAPDRPTHDRSFDELARPYSLLVHGNPPSHEVFSRGDVVYFKTSRDDRIPENHAFVIDEVREQTLSLVNGRELSVHASVARDVSWRPSLDDEVRIYSPAMSLASQDLIIWKKDDERLLVRGGTYAEVLEVQPRAIVVAGVTSDPELLAVDTARWASRWHRDNGTWHLTKLTAREQARGRTAADSFELSIV